MWMLAATLTISGLLFGDPVRAQDLSATSIEDLMQVEVTCTAPRAQVLPKTPAAAFVIRADDLRRSGALRSAQELRLAPGFQVARIDAQEYAISARGFNNEFSDKMLIDGRGAYVIGLGGVGWEAIAYTVPRKIDNPHGGAPLNKGRLRASYAPKALHRLDRLDLHGEWKLSPQSTSNSNRRASPKKFPVKKGTS
jgi:hypothetical protein